MKRIKMVDLAAQNLEIREDAEAALADLHRGTAYVGGPEVEAFEREFAEYLSVRHVIGVGSGTDALRLSLLALGVGAGDEVITTPMTFIATAAAIMQTGAHPAFVDIDPATGNLSLSGLRRYLEQGRFHAPNGPKVVLPVHLYGMPAPMTELRAVAEQYGLKIVEDACQAHGARVVLGEEWVRAGTAGAAGCFSFYPGKNLGAWGEAGAVATNDEELAARIALLRDHGRISHYAHQECGYNARLDAIQAAVLRVKLKRLDDWNSRRRALAESYRELMAGWRLSLPPEHWSAEPCYHLFTIRSPHRDALRNALLANQIECGIHYPVPLHLQPALRSCGYRHGDFPASERLADTVLSLPMHAHLTDLEVVRVTEIIERELENESPESRLFAGDYWESNAQLSPMRGQ
jgi:dTDP-4-amino-4,6-dideoxygalactose transaminase